MGTCCPGLMGSKGRLVGFRCSEKSKRRTKTVAGTLEPKWNQTFIYAPMKRSDVRTQSLQMTVYDYDRIGSGEYVGEVRTTALDHLISSHLGSCPN